MMEGCIYAVERRLTINISNCTFSLKQLSRSVEAAICVSNTELEVTNTLFYWNLLKLHK